MSSIFSLYIEASFFQAAELRISGGSVTVLASATLGRDQLERFLAGCRGKRFIVCCNPEVLHQHILLLPPAARGQYQALIRSELRKVLPESESLTTFHCLAGQSTVEDKVYNRVATFSYPAQSLTPLLETFTRQGKEISRLYAACYPIFRLAAAHCPGDEARLFVASLPGEKLLLLGENGALQFVRKVPAAQDPLVAEELPQLKMTLDYCAQSLRLHASEVVLLQRQEPGEALPPLPVPLRYTLPQELAPLPGPLSGHLAPLAAALHYCRNPEAGDILPTHYRLAARHRKTLARGSALLALLALLAAGWSVKEALSAARLKPAITALRIELAGAATELARYRKLDREAQELRQRLASRHSYSSAEVLAELSRLGSADCSLKAIATQHEAGAMKVRIDGEIAAPGFAEAQSAFERVIRRVAALPGFTVTASRMDMKLKTFDLEARYHAAGAVAP